MIYFTGDICLCDKAFDIGYGVGSQIREHKLQPFALLNKNEGDVWIGNFEGVVADVSNRVDFTRDSFRISSDSFAKVNNIIDYWGIANNHVMEHGEEAYHQMESILNSTSKGTFGSINAKSITFRHQKQTITITGFNLRAEDTTNEPQYWIQPELKEIEEEYQNIKDADLKVAYIHWGVEYVNHPSLDQIRLAHWLIDLGYDLIIGMHPHVLQGYEIYKGKYIFYSLGNFVFNMKHDPCLYGAIVSFDVKTQNVKYQYIKINDHYQPHIIDETEVPDKYKFETLNKAISKTPNIEKYVAEFNTGLKAYRKSNNRDILKNIHKYKLSILIEIITGFIKRRLHHAY